MNSVSCYACLRIHGEMEVWIRYSWQHLQQNFFFSFAVFEITTGYLCTTWFMFHFSTWQRVCTQWWVRTVHAQGEILLSSGLRFSLSDQFAASFLTICTLVKWEVSLQRERANTEKMKTIMDYLSSILEPSSIGRMQRSRGGLWMFHWFIASVLQSDVL